MNHSEILRSCFFSKLFPVNVQNYYILEFPFLKFILGSFKVFLDMKTYSNCVKTVFLKFMQFNY